MLRFLRKGGDFDVRGLTCEYFSNLTSNQNTRISFMSYVVIPHAKERGEWGELCFMARIAKHGLRVTKP